MGQNLPKLHLLTLSVLMSAAPASANESSFSFKMAHRYVSGKDNDINHKMEKGTLTVSGELWATHCASTDKETGKTAVPELVRIHVVEDSFLRRSIVCSFSVQPSATIGKKTSFETTCDTIQKSSIHLIAYQTGDNDYCTIEATGTLTTK